MIVRLDIVEFLEMAVSCPVIDVRSPAEFAHAHIPGAINLPLFTNEERAVVGTAYKQQSREQAIKIGLDYFGGKMRPMVEEIEGVFGKKQRTPVLVHCWRGGMRSAAVAWLLNLYGFKVYTLEGGYKAFRNWVLAQFSLPYPFNIVGGYTGSGKTEVLETLREAGEAVVDLEGLAQHKGSAFGGIGKLQPSQEMFENLLARQLQITLAKGPERIWIEDESQRIGLVNIPAELWKTMRKARAFFLNIPFEERLSFIVGGYARHKKEDLVNAIIRIQKKLGSQATRDAIGYLVEDNFEASFGILLHYYDKFYKNALLLRAETSLAVIEIKLENVDSAANAHALLSFANAEDFTQS